MTRIVAHINLYNGAQFLSALLYNLHRHVDEIVVFDGAWAGLLASGYFKSAHSTDNSRAIFDAFPFNCPARWVEPPRKGWESHAHKRAAQFAFLRDDDWQYLLNDDELPIGNIDGAFAEIRALRGIQCVWVEWVEVMGFWEDYEKEYAKIDFTRNRISTIPRFFQPRPAGMFYGFAHVDLLDRTGQDYLKWKSYTTKTMQIVHLLRLRPPKAKDRKFQPGNLPDVHIRGSLKVVLA